MNIDIIADMIEIANMSFLGFINLLLRMIVLIAAATGTYSLVYFGVKKLLKVK